MLSSGTHWFLLFIAGIFEVIWVFFLKSSKSFTVLTPTILFIISLIASMWLLATSMKSIPMGIAYPVWTGIGAVGSIIVGILFYKEPISVQKFFFLALILIGIIGLKLGPKY